MPRPCRTFTDDEIQTVRRMQEAGEPRTRIAETIGLTTPSFAWHMQCGRFGNVELQPGRQAGRRGKLQRADIEAEGQIFGCPKNEWELRQIGVRNSWTDEELERRAAGELPNRKNNYSLFEKDNPNRPPQQTQRNQQWPRKF